MSKTVKIICTDSEDTMIHWPDGRVQFVGFLTLIRLLWALAWNEWNIDVVDSRGKQ